MFRYASRIEKAWQIMIALFLLPHFPLSIEFSMKRDDLMNTDKKHHIGAGLGIRSFTFFFNLKSNWLVRCVILMTLGTI